MRTPEPLSISEILRQLSGVKHNMTAYAVWIQISEENETSYIENMILIQELFAAVRSCKQAYNAQIMGEGPLTAASLEMQ